MKEKINEKTTLVSQDTQGGEYSVKQSDLSRRDFIKTSAAVSLGVLASGTSRIFAAGSDKIRVGLIGCGGRGTRSIIECSQSSKGVELVAMADLFRDRLETCRDKLEEELPAECLKVTDETCFWGFDAYKKVIACDDVDVVLLITPPHFRPEHLKAAIEAGKHVFMEKPVTVDPVGVRSIIASSELAEQKGLAIVAGTQRRHQAHYLEIMKRVHNGDIGELVAAQCYWNYDNKAPWGVYKRQPTWSDMEWQCRNWFFFTWLCGDHIVEQHLHNIDVVNWAMGSHPVKALGIGGREVRTGKEYGNIFDHFTVEYEYPNGARVLSMCRQMDGTSVRISEHIVGTKGTTYTDKGVGIIEGQNAYKYEGESPNPYVQEHGDLIASIRAGKPLNEGRRVAESTMTAVLGRMSAYTGRELSWNWVMNKSQLDLRPPEYAFCDLPVRPIAIPGETKLI